MTGNMTMAASQYYIWHWISTRNLNTCNLRFGATFSCEECGGEEGSDDGCGGHRLSQVVTAAFQGFDSPAPAELRSFLANEANHRSVVGSIRLSVQQ